MKSKTLQKLEALQTKPLVSPELIKGGTMSNCHPDPPVTIVTVDLEDPEY
jgi:hypothetical protein